MRRRSLAPAGDSDPFPGPDNGGARRPAPGLAAVTARLLAAAGTALGGSAVVAALAALALATAPLASQTPDSAVARGSDAPAFRTSGPDTPDTLSPGAARGPAASPGPGAHPGDAARPDSSLRSPGPGAGWARWAESAAGLATLLAADRAVRRTAQDLRRDNPEGSVPDDLAQLGNDLGTWKKTVPFLAAGALGGGALLDGSRGTGRGASLLAGVLAGSMASEAVNRMVGRGRPAWGRGAYSFRPFTGHASFPSGHAAYLFSVAGAVDAVSDGWLPSAAAYGVAGLTAYGRLYDDRHWLSDVVVGAVLGSTVSRLATRRAMRMLGVAGEEGNARPDGRQRSAGRPGPELSLLATPSRIGVRIRF